MKAFDLKCTDYSYYFTAVLNFNIKSNYSNSKGKNKVIKWIIAEELEEYLQWLDFHLTTTNNFRVSISDTNSEYVFMLSVCTWNNAH